MKKLPKIQHVLLFVLGLLSINACEKLPENDIEENLAIEGLACGNYTANGILVAEQDVADGFVISIPYTKSTGGSYAEYKVLSSGITGLTATLKQGSLMQNGGNLTFIISGKPSGVGTANLVISFARASCTLSLSILPFAGTISDLNCSNAVHSGALVAGSAANGVSSVVPYSGGNGGSYIGQTVSSSGAGVTGLTATLQPGTFERGDGNLVFAITGTPSGTGTAIFSLNIAGRTCALTRTVTFSTGQIGELRCTDVRDTSAIVVGMAMGGVVIPYSGGNGGTHDGQIVTSTGVTGLTATLQPGGFANGNGTLFYRITGTPNSAGTAVFSLNIGGRACTLTRTVFFPSVNRAYAMKNIPGGTFPMGCNPGERECTFNLPVRNVTLSAFQMGETEVTEGLYQGIMRANPMVGFGLNCDSCPVARVGWFTAIEFCNRLSIAEGLRPCYYSDPGFTNVYVNSLGSWALPDGGAVFRDPSAKGYRLPTEAEWEYAARGGNNDHIYSGGNTLDEVAWFAGNSGNMPRPVKRKAPNGYGLYDMSGNVHEWCEDYFAAYPDHPQTNPSGPSAGTSRVVRGGDFHEGAGNCRVYYRTFWSPSMPTYYIHPSALPQWLHGFRVARSL